MIEICKSHLFSEIIPADSKAPAAWDELFENPFKRSVKEFHYYNRQFKPFEMDISPDQDTTPSLMLPTDEFRKWQVSPKGINNVFWISGPQGVGKSALIAAITRRLKAFNPYHQVPYFFVPKSTPLDPRELIGCFIRHLAPGREVVEKCLLGDSSHETMVSISNMSAPLEKLFENLVKPLLRCWPGPRGVVYYLIDGLDSCITSRRTEIVRLIRLFHNACGENDLPNLRLLITYRPTSDIAMSANIPTSVFFLLPNDHTAVSKYIRRELERKDLWEKLNKAIGDPETYFKRNSHCTIGWVASIFQDVHCHHALETTKLTKRIGLREEQLCVLVAREQAQMLISAHPGLRYLFDYQHSLEMPDVLLSVRYEIPRSPYYYNDPALENAIMLLRHLWNQQSPCDHLDTERRTGQTGAKEDLGCSLSDWLEKIQQIIHKVGEDSTSNRYSCPRSD